MIQRDANRGNGGAFTVVRGGKRHAIFLENAGRSNETGCMSRFGAF